MKLIILAIGAWLMIISQSVAQNQYTKQDIEQMVKNTNSTKDEGFRFFSKNKAMINGIMGEDYAENQLKYWIYKTDIAPVVEPKDAQPQWVKLEKKVIKQHGTLGEEIIWRAKFIFFLNKKDWPSFVYSYDPYIQKYSNRMAAFEINNYAWNVFEQVTDKKLLQKAAEWSKISIEMEKQAPAPLYDTYANLLYKIGQTQQALEAQQKAINTSLNDAEKATFQKVLGKMKAGKPTWPTSSSSN